MKKILAFLALFVVAALSASAIYEAPVWRLTSMCDAPDGHVMRARSEDSRTYSEVLWTLVGTEHFGEINLPGTVEGVPTQVYFLVPQKGTVKLSWNGYETVKAMNNNVCSDEQLCTFFGGDYCPQPEIPEFGIVGALAVLGLAGLFIARRRN
jgi:hypothetical protein